MNTAEYVWLPHPSLVWTPARILQSDGGLTTYETMEKEKIQLEDSKVNPKQLERVAESSLRVPGTRNLVLLDEFGEGAVIYQLRERYKQNLIYTGIGTILVSVNPYQLLPLYTPALVAAYKQASLQAAEQDAKLEPHVYGIAAQAYANMYDDSSKTHAQAIIISGESGAGKTEATKTVLQYLSDVAGSVSGVEQLILQSNPILEAFGNSRTLRNNNSSRFGKYMEVHFDNDPSHSPLTGKILSCRILNYLLEKSRVVKQHKDERNYHIFYFLLSGLPQEIKDKYQVMQAKDYHYLNQSSCYTIPGVNDAHEFDAMCKAMTILQFSDDEREQIFRILIGILQLGNLKPASNPEKTEITYLPQDDTLTAVINTLGLAAPELLNSSLCYRSVKVRGSLSMIPLNIQDAMDNRDALAKTLYGKLFDYLVWRMNQSLHSDQQPDDDIPAAHRRSCGILDIFGFEIFEHNYFEQFCINYANEKLQQHFNLYIFKLEQEEYKSESIDVKHIEFIDNLECLHLIERGKGGGILSMMDEEIVVPQGSDATLIEKMHRLFYEQQKHKHYDIVKKHPGVFIIKHYAGPVTYQSQGLLVKNKDKLSDTLDTLMRSSCSSIPLIARIFSGDFNNPDAVDSSSVVTTVDTMTGKKLTPSSSSASSSAAASTPTAAKKKDQTLGAQFSGALHNLMQTLYACTPHYIRCLKPNTAKKPMLFETQMVLNQMIYAGLFEAIRIRKSGFPFRKDMKEFVHRYRCCLEPSQLPTLQSKLNTSLKEAAAYLCAALTPPLSAEHYQIGLTKVFLRSSQRLILDHLRDERIVVWVVRLQCFFRAVKARRHVRVLRSVFTRCVELMQAPDRDEIQALLSSAQDRGIKLFIFNKVQLVLDALLEIERLIDQFEFQQNQSVQLYDDVKGVLDQSHAFISKFKQLEFLPGKLQSSSHARVQLLGDMMEKAEAQLELLLRMQQARLALQEAVTSENMVQLEAALNDAIAVGLMAEEYGSAQKLLEQLKAEEQVMIDLRASMNGTDLDAIVLAIERTRTITLDDARNADITAAYDKVKSGYTELVQDAIRDHNVDSLKSTQEKIQKLGFIELYNLISAWFIDDKQRRQDAEDERKRIEEQRKAEDERLAAERAILPPEERQRLMTIDEDRRAEEDQQWTIKIQSVNEERDRAFSCIPPPDYNRASMAVASFGRPPAMSIVPPPPDAPPDDDPDAPPCNSLPPPPPPPANASRSNSLAPQTRAPAMSIVPPPPSCPPPSTASRSNSIIPPPPSTRPSVFSGPPPMAVGGKNPIDEVLELAVQKRSLSDLEKHLLLASSQGHSSRIVRVAQNMLNILQAEQKLHSKLTEAVAAVNVERCKKLVKDATTLGYKDAIVEEARNIGYSLTPLEVITLKLKKALPTKNIELITALVKEASELKLESTLVEQARDFLAAQSGSDDWYSKVRIVRTQSLDASQIDAYRSFISSKGGAPLDTFVHLRRAGNYAKRHYLTKSNLKETRTQWQKDDIPRSLVKLSTEFCGGKEKSKALKITAKQIFKNIRGWMRDVYHSYPATLGYDVVLTGFNEPLLKDEIFCQLIKQTTNNPSVDSLLLGLKLFYLCISSFLPSPPLRPIIFSHLSGWAHSSLPGHACGFSDVSDVATNCYLAYQALVRTHQANEQSASAAASSGNTGPTTLLNIKPPTMIDVEATFNGTVAKRANYYSEIVPKGQKQSSDVGRSSVALPPPPPPGTPSNARVSVPLPPPPP